MSLRGDPPSDFELTIGEEIWRCEGQMSLKIGNGLWKTMQDI
jgi:hypothetical protein